MTGVRVEGAHVTVQVSSAHGLPLDRLVVIDREGGDVFAKVSKGSSDLFLEVSESRFPLVVRAPGHVPSRVARDARSAKLAADALFSVVGPALRALVREIQVGADLPVARRERLASLLSYGFTDEHTWKIATDAMPYRQWGYSELEVKLVLLSGGVVVIRFQPEPGMRASHRLTLAEAAFARETAPLHVALEMVRLGSVPEVALWSVYRRGEVVPIKTSTSWGSCAVYPPLVEEQNGALASGSVVFERVPLGLEYGVSALAPSSGDHARAFFVHDGSPLHLRLVEGQTIRGTLVAPDRVPGPAADVRWSYGEGDERSAWGGEIVGLPLSQSGAFSFASPQRVSRSLADPDLPGPFVEILLEVPGFEPVPIIRPARSLAILELGEIHLIPSGVRILVAPRAALDIELLRYNTFRVGPGHPNLAYEIKGTVELPGGFVELRLTPKSSSGREGCRALDLAAGAWTVAAWEEPDFLVLPEEGATQGRAFAKRGDGVFEEVEPVEYVVHVSLDNLPAEADAVYVGWSWQGIDYVCGQLTEAHMGETYTCRWEAPRGARIWWGTREFDDPSAPEDHAYFDATTSAPLALRIP